MKIVIAGGSGQVGRVLSRAFLRDGHEVVVESGFHFSYPHWANAARELCVRRRSKLNFAHFHMNQAFLIACLNKPPRR
jgi:nucleoside-diphosphate-sugar epimerase